MFNINDWATKFFNQPTEAMSSDLSGVFFRMMMVDGEPVDIPQLKEEFLYKVIESRAKHIGLELSDSAKIFLMFLCQSPGNVVMYLCALRSKEKRVDMAVLTNYFPMGFPNENSLGDLWDAQKGYVNGEKCDNCLDTLRFDQPQQQAA